MPDKVDFRRTLDAYRAKRGEFRVLDVPDTRHLMLDGQGDPNTAPAFAEAVESLYPVAYAVKFASRDDLGRDYVVPPLEGLWWAEDMSTFTTARDKSRWSWTLLLMVPAWIPGEMVETAIARKAPARTPRLETLAEGRCVQTLHVGSFDDETAVLRHLHEDVVPGQGLRLAGTHHEIYLSDFRRTAPEKQRTILRQPVAPAERPAPPQR
ncbi:GyrI-like domain-containing protein [Blastococcus sp. SYSU D00820]